MNPPQEKELDRKNEGVEAEAEAEAEVRTDTDDEASTTKNAEKEVRFVLSG